MSCAVNIVLLPHHFTNPGWLCALRVQMGGQQAAKEIDKILSEVDDDKDGKIDFSEFCQMMRQGNEALLQSATTMRGRRKAPATQK